jgi:hypothetical protein
MNNEGKSREIKVPSPRSGHFFHVCSTLNWLPSFTRRFITMKILDIQVMNIIVEGR